MAGDFHYCEPAHGHGLPHDPFNAIIGPRPIGWISTADGDGRHNLAPCSFFNGFNYLPPILGFSSIGWKDSVRNIEIVQLHTADRKPIDSWLVLGEVVAVHIDRALLKEGVYMTAEARPILRAGGPGSYARIMPDTMFDMRRPR